MERVVNASAFPVTTPNQTQSSTPHQSQQNTQPTTVKPNINYTEIAGKLFSKPIGNLIKPYFAGSAAGAASSGVAGSGSSVVGLAGSATNSAVTGFGGAAGDALGKAVGSALPGSTATATGGGLASGFKAGIGGAVAGIAGGLVGNKLFGGKGGTGGSLGASIGFVAGGLPGAAVGALFGGALGGMFGDEKRSEITIATGGKAEQIRSVGGRGVTHNTDLGSILIDTKRIGDEGAKQIADVFSQSDAQVATLFSGDQLERVKLGIQYGGNGQAETNVSWGESGKSERATGLIETQLKERYATAVGGLDPDFYGTFNRIADKDSIGGAISTFAAIDRDLQGRTGIFADFNPQQADPSQLIRDDDIRLQKETMQKPNMTGIAAASAKPRLMPNPDYDATVAEAYRLQQANRNIVGYENNQALYGDSAGIGNQALDHIAKKYGIEARPVSPEISNQRALGNNISNAGMFIGYSDASNKKAMDAYNNELKDWESKVLDAYADDYRSQQHSTPVITRTDQTPTQGASLGQQQNTSAGDYSSTRQRLFSDYPRQTVTLNPARPAEEWATHAGGLLSRARTI